MKLLEKLAFSKLKNKYEKDLDIIRKIRLAVPAQSAAITPPLGPMLGQFGINVLEFCKQFNEASKYFDVEVILLVEIILYRNKTFSFNIFRPSVGFLVYEIALSYVFKNFVKELTLNNEMLTDIQKQSSFVGSIDFEYPSYISIFDFYKVVLFCSYFTSQDIFSLSFSLRGTLRSMNIKIIN